MVTIKSTTLRKNTARNRVSWRCLLSGALLCITLLATGCGSNIPPVDSTYGRRENGPQGGSVNGTAVLSDMFEEAGYEVATTRFLGRLVNRSDVVVWMPDSYDLPASDVQAFFLDWLIEQPGRTLIYVARDFDATVAYWDKLESQADPESAIEYRRREALARSAYDDSTSRLADDDECPWFEIDRTFMPRRATDFRGPWSQDLDAKKTDVWIGSRIIMPQDPDSDDDYSWQTRELLSSGDDVIAAEISRALWDQSRIIVVNNGSWLLNMPLVNHENRKLAGRLIEECGPVSNDFGSDPTVTFVESRESPQIAESGPRRHHGLEAFTVWPINAVLLHLTALGMLYCFSVFPIFGRARRVPARDNSDFGRHITALGDLLRRTGDEDFAREQITNYQQQFGEAVPLPPPTADGNPFAPTTTEPPVSTEASRK